MSNHEGTHQVMFKFSPTYHDMLIKLTLRRSAELGKRVSMGYVLQELLEANEQLANPEHRSSDFYGSQD